MNQNANKKATTDFLELVVAGAIGEAYDKHISADFRHHNPHFPGDAASLQQAMEEKHIELPNKVFEIQRAIADGDFVAVHSRLRMDAKTPPMAVVHIFRFENGRIAEMWDVAQVTPDQSPNEHGMF